jgi:Flp pilus assembly protein TadB
MTKLFKDKAFRIWLFTVIMTAIIYAIPAGWIQAWIGDDQISVNIIRALTVAVVLVLMLWQNGRYSRFAADTANHAANYNEPQECEDDIFIDISTYAVLLVISVALLIAPLGIAAMMLANGTLVIMWNFMPLDWMIGYAMITLFSMNFAKLRRFEAHLTVRNCLQRMREQNPSVIRGGT